MTRYKEQSAIDVAQHIIQQQDEQKNILEDAPGRVNFNYDA